MVGGDFAAGIGAAEAEGVVLVGGTATFATGGYYSVGVAGAGSRVAPPAGSDMLVTGGNVNVGATTTLDIGSGRGGNLLSGGTVAPLANVVTSGGTVTENAAAPLSSYSGVVQGYRDLSDTYAAMAPTPGATVDAASQPDRVIFTGDGTTDRQVFEIPAGTDLGGIGGAATKTLVFRSIAVGTVVVINVRGAAATLSANSVEFGGIAVNPMSTADTLFSDISQSMVWNFADATAVTLGGEDQLPGSILVPQPGSATTVQTGTNGRFYAAGDVTTSGSPNAGLEFHNYRFAERVCSTGDLTITKTLSDPDAVAAGRLFAGDYTCVDGAGVVVAAGRWSLPANATLPVSGVADGALCSVSEDAPAGPSAADASYSWAPPAVTPPAAIVAGATTAFEVHNEVRRAVGDLELVKTLVDPYDVVDLTRFYSGSFSCLYNGADVTPGQGTWRQQAGPTPVRIAVGLPAGTVCTLSEDPLAVPPLAGFPQYHWAQPVISPAAVTIADGAVSRITVTNVVEDPTTAAAPFVDAAPPAVATPQVAAPAGPSAPAASAGPPVRAAVGVLAYTGADTLGPLLVAAAFVLIGLAGLVMRNLDRRERRSR